MPTSINPTRPKPNRRPSSYAWFAFACVIGILPLRADLPEGTSSSTPLTLNVSSTVSLTAVVLPVSATTSILATPVPSVSGTAPGAYSVSGSPTNYTAPTAGVNLDTSLLGTTVDVNVGTLSIGATVLTNSASSTVDGSPGFRPPPQRQGSRVSMWDLVLFPLSSTLWSVPR